MKYFLIVFLLIPVLSYADISEIITDKPMPVNIEANPVSLNGTYDIERFVIIGNKSIFIDSGDRKTVDGSKGEVTIDLNITGNKITSVLKMQMDGNVFKTGSVFADYGFIFTKRMIPLEESSPDEKKISLEDKLSAAGLHYYAKENKLVWEIPFENDKIIIMVLDKGSNKIKNLTNSKYLFL